MTKEYLVLLYIRLFGIFLLIGGSIGAGTLYRQYGLTLPVLMLMILVVLGLFMTTIEASKVYSSQDLFKFTWHDFLFPIYATIILLMGVLLQVIAGDQVREAVLWVFRLGLFWAVYVVMMRIGARVGVRLAQRISAKQDRGSVL